MYDNILESGVTLRTLRATDYDKLVSDINFNFQQVLNLPVFRGIRGIDGASIQGFRGQRGSNWVFASSVNFIANYDLIVSGTQVTTSFINAQLAIDQTKLMSTLNVESLAGMDAIVLPNGKVIQFDSANMKFNDTPLTFSNQSTMSEESVRSIVTQMTSGQASTNPVNTIFVGTAKNSDDTKPGLNTSYNNNSILDIPVLGAQNGYNLSNYLFYAPKESYVSKTTQFSQIVGSPADYHDLVQKTLRNQTVHYLPGIDDFSSLTILQNNLKNGIMIGARNSDSIRQFSRIYNNGTGLMLTSSYSPQSSEFSSMHLSDSDITLRAIRNFVLTCSTLDLTNATSINHKQLLIDAVQSALGSIDTETVLYGNKIKLQWSGMPNQIAFLSISSDGTLSQSAYSPVNTLSELVPSDAQQKLNIVTQYYVEQAKSKLTELIASISNRLDGFSVDMSALMNRGVIHANTAGQDNMNALMTVGTRSIVKPSAGFVYQNYPFLNMNDQSMQEWDYAIIDVNYAGSIENEQNNQYIVQTVRQHVANSSDRLAYRIGKAVNGAVTYTWSNWTYPTTSYLFLPGLQLKSNDYGELILDHMQRALATEDITFSDGSVISYIKFDSYGHPIAFGIKNLDDRYMNKTDLSNELSKKIGVNDTASDSAKLNGQSASEYFTKSETSKRSEFTGTVIDFKGDPVLYKTLQSNTTISFKNFVINKCVSLEVSGNYALQIPGARKINGSYNGSVLNLVQFYCTNDAGNGTVWVTISQASV